MNGLTPIDEFHTLRSDDSVFASQYTEDEFEKWCADYDIPPIGATVWFKWLDDSAEGKSYISFGEYNEETNVDSYGVNDDYILFYCSDESALKSLMTEGIEDFIVTEYTLAY